MAKRKRELELLPSTVPVVMPNLPQSMTIATEAQFKAMGDSVRNTSAQAIAKRSPIKKTSATTAQEEISASTDLADWRSNASILQRSYGQAKKESFPAAGWRDRGSERN